MVPRDSHVSWLSCSLGGNNIGAEGASVIGEVLKVNKKLTTITHHRAAPQSEK